MNYGEVIEQIRDLGFGEDDEIEEFGTIVPNAINRAITEINLNYAPINKYMDIVQPSLGYTEEKWESDGLSDQLIEYKMPDDFMRFGDVPVKRALSKGVYQRFNDYEIEGDSTLIMSGGNIGTYRVFYVGIHEPFDLDSDSETEIPLPLKAHHLVPLLASYYVWLDDDQTKANEYYQKFQQELQSFVASSTKPRLKIRTDWSDGLWV